MTEWESIAVRTSHRSLCVFHPFQRDGWKDTYNELRKLLTKIMLWKQNIDTRFWCWWQVLTLCFPTFWACTIL